MHYRSLRSAVLNSLAHTLRKNLTDPQPDGFMADFEKVLDIFKLEPLEKQNLQAEAAHRLRGSFAGTLCVVLYLGSPCFIRLWTSIVRNSVH